jgi:hypothetical protein
MWLNLPEILEMIYLKLKKISYRKRIATFRLGEIGKKCWWR